MRMAKCRLHEADQDFGCDITSSFAELHCYHQLNDLKIDTNLHRASAARVDTEASKALSRTSQGINHSSFNRFLLDFANEPI